MKTSFSLSAIVLLTGCTIGTSSEIKTAEKLLQHFQCNNVETSQLTHSPITSFHQRTLNTSKERAKNYIKGYESGDYIYDMPLDEAVKQQFDIYKSACQSLGGIQPE